MPTTKNQLIFSIFRNQKQVKTVRGKDMGEILEKYTKYAQEKGFIHCIYNPVSFGNTGYTNGQGDHIILTEKIPV